MKSSENTLADGRQPIPAAKIREIFLNFFESKGHKVLPGSSLVPTDPTVLLTLAGMLQFKPAFLGQEKPAFHRATTVQKCLRMNDVENVGMTARHHTFFEMLGNFSFGDYFKKEAIQFAWELLVKEFKLPVTRLKIAIYKDDDEAFNIWHKEIGLPEEIIFRLGEENNFWSVGPTGPCGPCSEIYYDLGHEHGCGKPDCQPGCDCDRFLEIWNLVFIQYNRNEKGDLIPLKQKGIDTGMGLERIASVLQGVTDNFETDLFTSLIKKIKLLSGTVTNAPVKIIADHARAMTFLIADGVFPGNSGREYVLRRLIRRSIAYGRRLGINQPFLCDLSREVVLMMQDAYPQLKEKASQIYAVIREEEDNFSATLEQGMRWLEELLLKDGTQKRLNGKDVFRLHDTYGFPIELTAELAREKGLEIDLAGFEKEMQAQRERARQVGLATEKKVDFSRLDLSALKPTVFVGYENNLQEAKVLSVFPEHKLVALDKTPFYAESGGQVGDTGIFSWNGKHEARVINTLLTPGGVFLHELDNLDGLKEHTKLKALIDVSRRKAIRAHHTATHLLHKALREVLGDQVKQAGSHVGPDKLRFDFNHFHGLSVEELQKIEQIVNDRIREKIKVETFKKNYKEALTMGATALFGEKYGDEVRIVKIGNYSLELCGGTHIKNTSEIMFFKIISESAVGSGVRRIEALAEQEAKIHVIFQAKSLHDMVDHLISQYRLLQVEKEKWGGIKSLETNIFEIEVTELERLSKAVDGHDSVNVNKFLAHLCGRVDWLKERIAKAEKEIESLKTKKVREIAGGCLSEAREVTGKKVLLKKFENYEMEMLRTVSDTFREQLKSCVLLLASVFQGKLTYLVLVTPDLVASGVSAKKIAEAFSSVVGGRGGGKDDKVEGGGKDPSRIEEGFDAVLKILA